MSAIPDDIMVTAKQSLDAIETFPDGTYPGSSYGIIARAVLAERQRCAAIALCVFDDEDVWSDSHRIAGGIIAEAILAGDNNEQS